MEFDEPQTLSAFLKVSFKTFWNLHFVRCII